jgi:Protein of unknown function (DUF3179)
VIGLINGLAILADRETRTHWDHITGEAFSGPLTGRQLQIWPIRITTLAAALAEDPSIKISFSSYRSFIWRLAQKIYPRFIYANLWLPFPFYATMSQPIDPRLNKLTQGLGVMVKKSAKYYPLHKIPLEGITDLWNGRSLQVSRGLIDGVPRARWTDTNEEPMQLLSRWYGFSFTYPGCEVYQRDG